MISKEKLEEYRLQGNKIKVMRSYENEEDAIEGIIVAWNDSHAMVRKSNRRVILLSREYEFIPLS